MSRELAKVTLGESLLPSLAISSLQTIHFPLRVTAFAQCGGANTKLRSRTRSKPIRNSIDDATSASTTLDSLALPTDHVDEFLIIVDVAIERPQRRARADLAAEYLGLDPPRQHGADLVAHEGARRDREDVVEFLL